MKFKARIFTCVVVLLFSCKTQVNTTSTANSKPGMLYSGHFKKPVIDKGLYAATTELIAIDTAYALGDSLHIITPKILGCDADNFRLMWNGVYTTASPAETTVKLFEALDPACKVKSRFHLTFNIKPLGQKNDTMPNKTVLIRFGNYKGVVHYGY